MLKEEFRTHTSYSGKSRFLTFPAFVFFLSLGSGLTINKMLETVSLGQFALFYVALLLVPAILGLVAAAPFMGFAISSIGLFFVAILVSFMLGMSLSFLASVIYIRHVPAFIVFTAAIAVVFVLFGLLGILDP